jgi:hypothetical protein
MKIPWKSQYHSSSKYINMVLFSGFNSSRDTVPRSHDSQLGPATVIAAMARCTKTWQMVKTWYRSYGHPMVRIISNTISNILYIIYYILCIIYYILYIVYYILYIVYHILYIIYYILHIIYYIYHISYIKYIILNIKYYILIWQNNI